VNIENYLLLWNRFPRSSLLLLTLPLLLLNGHHHSLMAHDEGYYAVQARWIWETGDWLTPQFWGTPIYDRTIGIQWSIALAYHLCGLNEFSARLPSIIACLFSVLLTYEIGKILFNRQIAWLGGAILMLMGLWVNEAHTAQQNTALISIELLGIWSLLQIADTRLTSLSSSSHSRSLSVRASSKVNWGWGVIAGATVGWGFLFKGFMIFVPIVALLPYIIDRQRYRKLITNPGIYLGLIVGAIPTGLWLILSCNKYGLMPVQELVGKILILSQTNTYNPGPFYYLWNLPMNIFPWALFSLIGAAIVWQKLLLDINYSVVSLTLGYPISLFILLSLFRTRMPYYSLQLLPFMALLAAAAFAQFIQISHQRSSRWYLFVTWLGYAFSGLGILLAIAGIIVIIDRPLLGIIIPPEIHNYALPAVILGCGWMTIPILWQRWRSARVPYWLASWLIPAWFTVLSFGLQGAFTNKNPDFIAAFHHPSIDRAIAHQPVNLLINSVEASGFQRTNNRHSTLSIPEHQSLVLLSFYTPHLGKKIDSFTDLPDRSYAWTLSISPQLATQSRTIGTVQDWKLIQKLS
jgi:4-amino-4-deoxy-L-arabinose transferase-like glycosyltransferase